MKIDEIYLVITLISCTVSIMSMFFAAIPFILFIKMAQKYQDTFVVQSELIQDMRQTIHHVATVVQNFTELVNKNTA